ncbi:MAG: MaoC family dehydratase [Pseudomonadota bacterium]
MAPENAGRPTTDRDWWFEDFAEGQSWRTEGATFTEASILDFAFRYDPQPFHLDLEASKAGPYGGLIASGFQTLSTFFRLWHAERIANPSSAGSPGMEELRWPAPVRPGDTIRGLITVESVRASKSRPRFGLVGWRYEGFNQKDALIFSARSFVLHHRRPLAEDAAPEIQET